MRLVITGVCLLIVSFSFGQKLSNTKPVLAYGVNLNMGNASIKTWLGDYNVQKKGAGLRLNQSVGKAFVLSYGLGLNKMTFKKVNRYKMENSGWCGTVSDSPFLRSSDEFGNREVSEVDINFGSAFKWWNREQFKAYVSAKAQANLFLGPNIYIDVPGIITNLAAGTGVMYKISNLISVDLNFEVGQNVSSLFGFKNTSEFKMLEYKTGLSVYFQV